MSSYYKLPKNSFCLNVQPVCSSEEIKLYLSQSLHNYYNKLMINISNTNMQIDDFLQNNTMKIHDDISLNNGIGIGEMLKFVHPCEYVFSDIPGLKQTVSKLTYKSNVFYELLEICNTINLLDNYKSKNINSLHICKDSSETIECINMFINGTCLNNNIKHKSMKNIDEIINVYTNLMLDTDSSVKKYDFIFCSVDIHESLENDSNNNETMRTTNHLNYYFLQLLQIVILVLKYQTQNGLCIIKLGTTFHKPVVDVLFMLTTLYDKTFIIKPASSRITSFEKYIVCKNFTNITTSTISTSVVSTVDINKHMELLGKLYNFYYECKLMINKNKNIISFLPNNLPYLFLNKIEDINNILGQQQLEAIDQIGHLIKNRNKEDKLELMKKSNIQKSIHWCEKNRVPHNKFSDNKTNIFL